MMTKITRLAILTLFVMLLVGARLVLAQQAGPEVVVIDVEGPVTPVMLSYIERGIEEADLRNAEALVIRLNTPGGSVDLTRQIIQAIIISDVPVVVYVWPPGGFAASAGTFITLAGHVAAMSPNTSIGAASPVDQQGGDINETLRAKVENILIADIKGLADHRGEEALQWAEEAITEAKAASAEEALEIGVVDFIADDLEELLGQLDGFTVTLGDEAVTLSTGQARIFSLEPTTLEQILRLLTNPTIALFLISIGGLAITYELIYPGGYMSGVIGIICLLVGMYGIGQLPVNYAGLALLLLSFILFGAELFTPTFGALTAAGIASFIVGALILFNTSEFAYDLPLASIIGIPIALGAIFAFGLGKAMTAMRRPVTTGQEGMVGATGTVKVELNPRGTVLVWGERWQAASETGQTIAAGERVEVTQVDGFRLKVRRAAE